MGDFLRLWFMNAVFLGAAIAAIRTTYSRLGGELDVRYTLREALSIALASLAFTVVYNLPALAEATSGYVGAALFSPGCIAMMLLYRFTHVAEIDGSEAALIGFVFVGLHAVTLLLAVSL